MCKTTVQSVTPFYSTAVSVPYYYIVLLLANLGYFLYVYSLKNPEGERSLIILIWHWKQVLFCFMPESVVIFCFVVV